MNCCKCSARWICPFYWVEGSKCDTMNANVMMEAEHGPCEKFNQQQI